MSSAPLAKKLLIRPGNRVLALNAPSGFLSALESLPDDVTLTALPEGSRDVVLLFARTRAEMDQLASSGLAALKPGGVFWGCYPKGS